MGERERDIYTLKWLSKQASSGCTCIKFCLHRRRLLDPRKHISDDRSRITDRWVLNHFIVRWNGMLFLMDDCPDECLSFRSHQTRIGKNNGCKGAELNLSHSLAILAFLLPLKMLYRVGTAVERERERERAGTVRVKYSNIDERVVPRVDPQPFRPDVGAIPIGHGCRAMPTTRSSVAGVEAPPPCPDKP